MSDGDGWPTEAEYAWAEERDPFCVSFVEATVPEAMLARMVGGSSMGTVSVVEASEWAAEQTAPDHGSAIETGLVDGWVLAVEENGYQATLPEAVHRISRGSRAIVVFCDVYCDTSFVYAVDGVVVRSFDPLLYDHPTPWDGPALPEESGLDFGNHPMASALACAERLTGVRLTPDLVDDHGDRLATGHHTSHSLVRAALSAADTANAERQARMEDPRRQSIPNRLTWGDQLPDASQLFLPGWIGWIQFLLCVIAVAPVFALQLAYEFEYLDDLPFSVSPLLIISSFALAVVVPGLTPMIGSILRRVASVIERARQKRPAGRAAITDFAPLRHSDPASAPGNDSSPRSSAQPRRPARAGPSERSRGADPEDLPSSTDTADDCLDWFFGALTETIQRNGVKLCDEGLALLVSDAPKALVRQRPQVVAMRPRLTMLLIQAIEADKALGGRLVGVPSGMSVPMSWKLRYDILSKSSDQSVLLYALDELFTEGSMGILLPA